MTRTRGPGHDGFIVWTSGAQPRQGFEDARPEQRSQADDDDQEVAGHEQAEDRTGDPCEARLPAFVIALAPVTRFAKPGSVREVNRPGNSGDSIALEEGGVHGREQLQHEAPVTAAR